MQKSVIYQEIEQAARHKEAAYLVLRYSRSSGWSDFPRSAIPYPATP